jgi:hypothetical protein
MIEAWSSNEGSYSIPGFQYFNKSKIKKKGRGRPSKGILFYYRKEFKPGVELEKSTSQNLLWVKLSKSFFGLKKDIFFCTCYLLPKGCENEDYSTFIHL